MLRLAAGSLSALSMGLSLFLLWRNEALHAAWPQGLSGWFAAYLHLFREPRTAFFVLFLVFAVVMGSWFITELLLGWLYSLLAAALSGLCLIGILAARFPHFADRLLSWFG